jgi:hypothetical protein
MDCRNARGKVRAARQKANGGSHTAKEWRDLLAATPACVKCKRTWESIPKRSDPRYKYTWTKGHKIPVTKGGTLNIENLQPECYQCNFEQGGKENSPEGL